MRPSPYLRSVVLAAALLLAHCAQNPVTGNPNLVLVSESQEVALGKFAEGHLRVINGLYPAGEPMKGQPLKVIE